MTENKSWRPTDWYNNTHDEDLHEAYEDGADHMLWSLLKYLDAPCDKHATEVKGCDSDGHYDIYERFERHRYLCTKCMEEMVKNNE